MNVPLVPEDAALEELALAISRSRGTVLAVTNDEGRFQGMISATDVTAALERTDEELAARHLAVVSPLRVFPDDQLGQVVDMMTDNDVRQLPVVALGRAASAGHDLAARRPAAGRAPRTAASGPPSTARATADRGDPDRADGRPGFGPSGPRAG